MTLIDNISSANLKTCLFLYLILVCMVTTLWMGYKSMNITPSIHQNYDINMFFKYNYNTNENGEVTFEETMNNSPNETEMNKKLISKRVEFTECNIFDENNKQHRGFLQTFEKGISDAFFGNNKVSNNNNIGPSYPVYEKTSNSNGFLSKMSNLMPKMSK